MITCNPLKTIMNKHPSKTLQSPIIHPSNLYRKNINYPHQFPSSSKESQWMNSKNYHYRTAQAPLRANAYSWLIISSNKDHQKYSSTWNLQNHSMSMRNNTKTPPVKAYNSDRRYFISNHFFNRLKVSSWILNDCIYTTLTNYNYFYFEKKSFKNRKNVQSLLKSDRINNNL